MINYDSILSAFDGKPTLLQWLKLVKKALDESVLKDITLKQDGASVVFTFNFEDGTSISTSAVTLPKGDTGAKGDKGDKGEQGVSITGVDEVSDEIVGSQTLTTLRFHFSDGTNNEVVVYAENGKNGGIGVIINQPASATSGTLTADQLATLQASDNNYVIFNNEIYRLADKQHTAGILSYTHTGWDGTAVKNKSINITISTLAWALVQGESGGKLYRHKTTLKEDGKTCVIYSLSSVMNPYANSSEAVEHIDDGCTVTGRKDNEPDIGWGIMCYNRARWTLSGITYSIDMTPISFISDSSEEV